MSGRCFKVALLALMTTLGCNKGESSSTTATSETAPVAAPAADSGCDHDIRSDATLKRTWPYPADVRQIRWIAKKASVGLQLKPRGVAIRTATVSWDKGETMNVVDSQMFVTKPRRVVAKHDMSVRRTTWDQGQLVETTALPIHAGEPVDFLFYDSRGHCLVARPEGTSAVDCSLEDTFEGVDSNHPFACQQTWWIRINNDKLHKGWLRFDADKMERVATPQAPAGE